MTGGSLFPKTFPGIAGAGTIPMPEDNERLVRKVLKAYPVGRVRRVVPIRQGFANLNFRVDTEAGPFLARLCRKQSPANIEKEMRLMAVLKKHAFPTAYPVARTDGRMICRTEPYPVVVYEFIEGSHPKPQEGVITQIAAALADLHAVSPSKVPDKDNALFPARCLALAEGGVDERCMDAETVRMWCDAFSRIETFLDRSLPTGLIHADLFPDNTLFHRGRLAAILDFEEFAVDHLMFDIGMTINGFCVTGNRPDREKIALFLATYQRGRPLTQEESDCLHAYIAWTALAMACWHLGDCREAPKPGQKARMRELTGRARQWLNET